MGFRTQASKWVVTEVICAPGCGEHVSWEAGMRVGLGNVRPVGWCLSWIVNWAVKVRLDPRFQETGVLGMA